MISNNICYICMYVCMRYSVYFHHVVGIILGYNLTDTTNMMSEYDIYVNRSSLNELTKYVCGFYLVSGVILPFLFADDCQQFNCNK